MPEKRIVVAGGNPVSSGTRTVAPNMATTCCRPIPMVRGHESRSSGITTPPGDSPVFPPTGVHSMPEF